MSATVLMSPDAAMRGCLQRNVSLLFPGIVADSPRPIAPGVVVTFCG